MVLILPFPLRNSLKIWPIVKVCSTSLPPPKSNVFYPFVDKGIHIIVISLYLHMKSCIQTTLKTPQNFEVWCIVGNHLVPPKTYFQLICLYFSKLVTCLFTKASLRYAIVCSMKKFMTIFLELSCGNLFKVMSSRLWCFQICVNEVFSSLDTFEPLTYAWLKAGCLKVCWDNC
jgi:hypothetical protein